MLRRSKFGNPQSHPYEGFVNLGPAFGFRRRRPSGLTITGDTRTLDLSQAKPVSGLWVRVGLKLRGFKQPLRA